MTVLSLACHCSYQYPSSPGFICCFARGLGCVTLLCLWLCAHLLLGLGFPMLPGYIRPPSGSESTGSSGYSSPLGFPTFAMGSPLRGRGLFVLDRNEGLVSPFVSGTLVSSWLDLAPLSAASLRSLSLRVCCQVVLAVSVSLGCPQLPPVFFPVPCWGSELPPRPLLWVWGCLGVPALLLPAGVLYLGRWLDLRPAAAGALLPGGPHCS